MRKQNCDKTILNREDFEGGPVSLDLVEPGLYLGNVTAATHLETLKSNNINYILTLDSVPLPSNLWQASNLTIKYIQISDQPKEDILHHFKECIDFINLALDNQKSILVHCYFGVSRSSAIIIAFIMQKYSLNYSKAFEIVKQRRKFIGPNIGFISQLKLFHEMNYTIDIKNENYKLYRLRLVADNVRKAKILPQNCMNLIQQDPGLIQVNPETIVYRCRKCRRILANKSNIITHKNKNINNSIQLNQSSSYSQNLQQIKQNEGILTNLKNLTIDKIQDNRKLMANENSMICKAIIFVEPIAWMKDILTQNQGRLNCPKCSSKLGSFSWINECHCPCGQKISPAFYFVPSKVELSSIVQNVQMTV